MGQTPIPYEQQQAGDRCGAACLCMLYRWLGSDCSQAEVWERLTANARGRRIGTHLLAGDALAQGHAALVLKAAEPWQLLQRCHAIDLHPIINHNVSLTQYGGHFSVVLEVGDEHLVLHDPQRGPDLRLTRDEALRLWQPRPIRSEISGNVLVAISRGPMPASACSQGHEWSKSLTCRRCQKEVTLEPAGILGCTNEKCTEKTWSCIYCPHCDASLAGSEARFPFWPF